MHELAATRIRPARTAAVLAAAALLLAAARPARAITDEEVYRNFHFNSVTPGARALAMGGAFLGVADDATAAGANPAGLTYLARPEIFTEIRQSFLDETGGAFAVKGGFGEQTVARTSPVSATANSFLSYVSPTADGRFVWSLSRQELLRQRNFVENSFGVSNAPLPGIPRDLDFFRAEGFIDVEVVNYQAGAAAKFGQLAIGATIGLSRARMKNSTKNSKIDEPLLENFGVVSYNLDYETAVDDTDVDYAVNVGALWTPNDRLSVGAVYRRAPRFELTEGIADTGRSADEIRDFAIQGVFTGMTCTAVDSGCQFLFPVSFHLPDRYGVGASFRVSDDLVVSGDLIRVEYTDLLAGLRTGFNALTFGDRARFTVDDGTEIHLGAEYTLFVGETPVSLRGGFYRDPDGALRADFAGGGSFASVNETFPGAGTTRHLTGGVGVMFQGHFQWDVAIDAWDSGVDLLTSFIYRF